MEKTNEYENWTREQLISELIACRTNSLNKPPIPAKSTDTPTLPTLSSSSKVKVQRVFDIHKHSARKIALQVSYFGWHHHGFASQPDDAVSTIEALLFNALTRTKLVPEGSTPSAFGWSRCGRTDKGVSAFKQVVSLFVRSKAPLDTPGTVTWDAVGDVGSRRRADTVVDAAEIKGDEIQYLSVLNRVLPPDVRVIAWSPVGVNFDARFDCVFRLYKYVFPASSVKPLNVAAMKDAAVRFVGEHNFRNFCKVDASKVNETYVREILDADVVSLEDDSQMHAFVVRGNAFLWHQVRCMMAILFLVGQGLENPSVVDDLMDMEKHVDNSGRPTYEIASEIPLILFDCGYPDGLIKWRFEDTNFEQQSFMSEYRLVENLSKLWSEYATKACQVNLLLKEYGNQIGTLMENLSIVSSNQDNKKYVSLMARKRCASIEEKIITKEKKRKSNEDLESTDGPKRLSQENSISK
ncbi:tRNA pseudouridine synthase 3 [Nowakowskiella sp. JEL0078]|nr:tRNA pseudouridine synthase 3 [Nowakowskiella sp. JEL0078]